MTLSICPAIKSNLRAPSNAQLIAWWEAVRAEQNSLETLAPAMQSRKQHLNVFQTPHTRNQTDRQQTTSPWSA